MCHVLSPRIISEDKQTNVIYGNFYFFSDLHFEICHCAPLKVQLVGFSGI